MMTVRAGRSLRAGRFTLPALVLVTLGTGCSVATGGGVRTSPRSGGDELTGEEIRASTADNLYDAIRQMKPRWLRPRIPSSFSMPESVVPIVYVNNVQFGLIDALYSMHVNEVMHARYVSPADATTRFGTGHVGGAIMVDLTR